MKDNSHLTPLIFFKDKRRSSLLSDYKHQLKEIFIVLTMVFAYILEGVVGNLIYFNHEDIFKIVQEATR